MTFDVFRESLADGRSRLLAWATLGSPYFIELAGKNGWDAVLIDHQHGIGGMAELSACLMAARSVQLPALVRVASHDVAAIGRALDDGAQGIMLPMVNSADDAKAFVKAVKYPPLGQRSWGPYRGQFLMDTDYQANANGWSITCAQIETREALDNLDAILATEGLDMVLVGPNDLSVSLTDGAVRNIRESAVVKALEKILERTRAAGKIAGVYANDNDYAQQMMAAGWNFVAAGSETSMLQQALSQTRDQLSGKV